MQLSEISSWGWRFSSLVPALLAVIPTYALAREIFGRRVAFVAGGLTVASPYFLAFARIGYNNSQALLPVALSIYLAAAGARRASRLLMMLSGLAAGAGFYTYGGGRLAAMVVPVYLLGLAMACRRSTSRNAGVEPPVRLAPLALTFLAGCLGVASPLLVYGAAVHPIEFRSKTLEAVFPNLQYARSLFTDAQLFRDHGPIGIDQSQFFFRADLYVALIGRGLVESAMACVSETAQRLAKGVAVDERVVSRGSCGPCREPGGAPGKATEQDIQPSEQPTPRQASLGGPSQSCAANASDSAPSRPAALRC